MSLCYCRLFHLQHHLNLLFSSSSVSSLQSQHHHRHFHLFPCSSLTLITIFSLALRSSSAAALLSDQRLHLFPCLSRSTFSITSSSSLCQLLAGRCLLSFVIDSSLTSSYSQLQLLLLLPRLIVAAALFCDCCCCLRWSLDHLLRPTLFQVGSCWLWFCLLVL